MINGNKAKKSPLKYKLISGKALYGRYQYPQYRVVQYVLHRYCRRYKLTLTGSQSTSYLDKMRNRYGFNSNLYVKNPPVPLYGSAFAVNYPVPEPYASNLGFEPCNQ